MTGKRTRTLTRSRDNLRRPTGFVLGNEHAVGYGYDVSGRLATLSAQGLPNLPGKTHAFEYTYEPGSSQLDKVTGPVHEVDNAYEPHRDVLLQKTNTRTVGTPAELSVIGYTVNAIGQREQRNLSGEIRADFYGGQTTDLYTTDWGYDALGQVTSEDKPSTSADRGFSYDQIGNRLTSAADGVTTTYTPNQFNQYTAITGSPALSPQYDLDGNMTSGLLNGSGSGQFEYDGANQLIRTQAIATSDPTQYAYDAFGRRIAKVTYPNGSAVASSATVFLYDGWNLIAEYKLSSGAWTLDRTYTWGIDLSGSTQGAGGVGGLLAVRKFPLPLGEGQGEGQSTVFYPCFDGNGNIEAYLDCNGSPAAIYQYDAFGNMLSGGGKGAALEQAKFSHRFSTKYQDAETGLLYYGYRYHCPSFGRWLNRDPIEEYGGMNLYGFVGNDGISRWDVLGLAEHEWHDLFTKKEHFDDWESLLGKGENAYLMDRDVPEIWVVGKQLDAIIYKGNNGPPKGEDPSCVEIEFEFKILRGNNSGFHVCIPELPENPNVNENVVAPAHEVQLLKPDPSNKNRNTALGSLAKSELDGRSAEFKAGHLQKQNTNIADTFGSLYMIKGSGEPATFDPSQFTKVRVMLNQLGGDHGLTTKISAEQGEGNWIGLTEYNTNTEALPIDDRKGNRNMPQVGAEYDPRKPGLIGLQLHGARDAAAFRNIKWRKATPEQGGGK